MRSKIHISRPARLWTHVCKLAASAWPRSVKKAGLASFALCAFSANAYAVPVTVEVNWPNWSSDNRVIIRDPSGNTLETICDPTNCFNANADSSYTQTFTYDFPAGTNYSIQMDDAFGDAWNGTNPFVRILVDGVLELNDNGPAADTETLNFDVAAPATGPQLCYGRPYNSMNFSSPVLLSGTALQPGARYRYSNVTTNTDAIVEIISFTSGGSLNSFDTDAGLVGNFQPELVSTGTSAVDFRFEFIDPTTSLPKAFDFLAAAIDVDGNSSQQTPLREYVEFDRSSNSYAINNPSELNIDASGPSSSLRRRFEARSLTTAPGIDPTAEQNIAVAFYSFKSSFNYRFGSLESGGGTRLTSLGFDCPNLSNPVFPVDPSYDYADAPASYGNPRHLIDENMLLGIVNNADSDGYNSPDADGDNGDDGITIPALSQGQAATISASVTGAGGFLQGWIDWNGDGDFNDTGEQVASDLADSDNDGIISFPVTPPLTAVTTQTFARFRWSTTSSINPTINADDGEVEDYALTVQPDLGPDPSTGTLSYANSGNGIYPGSIALLDWSGSGLDDGIRDGDLVSFALPSCHTGTLTAQFSNVSNAASAATYTPVDMQTWSGASAFAAYNGPGNGEALYGANGESVSFRVTWSMIIDGVSVSPDMFVIDAESTNVGGESITAITNGGNWSLVDNAIGTDYVVTGAGTQTFSITKTEGPSNSPILLSMNTTQTDISINAGGRQAVAFGTLLSCDYGDADGYASAAHAYDEEPASPSGLQSVPNQPYLGTKTPDSELSSQDTANADGDDTDNLGDDEDGVVIPNLSLGNGATITAMINGSGLLQGWIDWNGNSVFDAGEQVANDLQDDGTGSDMTANDGTIQFTVTPPADAVTSQTFARFRWSTASGLDATTSAPDGEVEDYALTVTVGQAEVLANKMVEVYDPTNIGLYALPGNDTVYTITVTNIGGLPADADTIELIDLLPPQLEFWNGDVDDGGPETDPVAFIQSSGSGMSLTYGTDVRFGTGTTKPANFAACSVIAPDSSYRPDLTYICLNPKGTLAAGDPDPEIALSFRTRIK